MRSENHVHGYWWDPARPDEKLAGELSWEPLRAPTLSLLDPPPSIWQQPDESAGPVVPMLHGRVARGGAVTLLDSGWGGMNIGSSLTETLRVGAVLMDVWLDRPDEAFIRRVKIRWPALRAMLGDYAVKLNRRPSSRTRRIRFDIKPRRLEWSDGGVAVRFQYDFPVSVSPTSSGIEAVPVALLASAKPRSYQWWREEWLVPLNDFMMVAIGTKSNPQSIRLWQKKNLRSSNERAIPIKVLSQGVGDHDFHVDKPRVLVTASDFAGSTDSIHSILHAFKRLKDEHPVFVGLLIDVANYPDRPLRNKYLDVISSLEAYHTQKEGLGPIDEETYKERRRSVLAAVTSAGVGIEDIRFLKTWLSGHSFVSLEKRLHKLGKQASLVASWKLSAQHMAKLRNYVAHGNADVSEPELQEAYDQAFELARRTVLHSVGLSPANRTC